MLKSFSAIFVIFLLVFSGCGPVSPPPAEDLLPPDAWFWALPSSGNELVFFGASNVRLNRDEAIRFALEDAARKAAMYHFVEGSYTSKTAAGAGYLDFRSGTEASLNLDGDFTRYVEELEFDPENDILQSDGTIFVRARYHVPYPLEFGAAPFFYRLAERPGWIENPRRIPGFMTGVGYAGRRASHRDTVNASGENAVFAIIRDVSSTLKGDTVNAQGAGAFNYISASGSTVGAAGVLNGFYVLETWVDPASKAVWSLAIAREVQHINSEETK
jgi:hypothetical protein